MVSPSLSSNKLSQLVLIPLILTLIVLFLAGSIISRNQFEQSLAKQVSQRVDIIERQLHRETLHITHVLEFIVKLISQNSHLREAFQSRNRDLLLQTSLALFADMENKLHISHFYFHDTQRVNYLRVHNPDDYGDTIDRLTILQAEKSGHTSSGIELGHFGSLTLRTVTPWLDEQGTLIGYLEIGVDIRHLLAEIAELNDVDMVLVLEKSAIDQQRLRLNNNLLQNPREWSRNPDYVISSRHGLHQHLINQIPRLNSILNARQGYGPESSLAAWTYRWQHIHVNTMNKQQSGHLMVALDISDQKDDFLYDELKYQVVYLLVSTLLLLLIYRFTQRAQKAEAELSQSMIRLNHLASYDTLTELPNRSLFMTELEQKLRESRRFRQNLAICFIDLDNFKIVNDTMGHDQGDRLLQQLSRYLVEHIRDYDVLARFGGDEFVLMIAQTSMADVITILDKLLAGCRQPILLNNEEVFISLSIGVSLYPDDGNTREELIRNADAAMYQAKEAGKNCYRFFTSSINDQLLRQKSLESRLRLAADRNEFSLYYQPQFDIISGQKTGYEALLRWTTSEGETVSPAEFIPVAERSSIILDIGDWVLSEACRQLQAWKNRGLDTRIDINVSSRQLRNNRFLTTLEQKLAEHQLSYRDLGIELTENILLEADESLINDMRTLVDKGMTIAIDDFGTGYSSLSYLKKFPITTVKIDQEFVRDAPDDPNDRAIMAAIVAMAHSLGLSVIVEGIETAEHEKIARDIGCDVAQGYFYQKPLPASELKH